MPRSQAEHGDLAEQFAVGMACAKGAGVQRDPKKAATWIVKAAKQNHAPAQNRLAFMHTIGDAVALDQTQATVWYRRAALHGDALGSVHTCPSLSRRGAFERTCG